MREEKKLLLQEAKDDIKNSQGFIVTRYKSMTAQHSWDLSKSLKKSQSRFKVLKKRIFQKAAKEMGWEYKEEDLEGHIGVVVFQENGLEAIKALMNFKEDNEGLIDIIDGQMEQNRYSASEIQELSKLPDKNGMRAQILGLLESPGANIVGIILNILTSVPHCLENKKELTKK